MKQMLMIAIIATLFTAASCQKSKTGGDEIPASMPRTAVPAELRGGWMYGNFSMTEYWSQNPGDYLGNGLEMAFAFQFNADGTYTQYFASRSVQTGMTTYQQSVTHGTVEFNTADGSFITHPFKAHYRLTKNNNITEERDLNKSELTGDTRYTYIKGTSAGTEALFLQLNGNGGALTFVKKF